MSRTPDKTEQDRDVMRLRHALDSIRPYLQAVCEHRVGLYRGDPAAKLLDRANRALDGRPTVWDVEQGHVSTLEATPVAPGTRSGGLKYDAERVRSVRKALQVGCLADAEDLADALGDIEELHQRVRDAMDAAASREACLTSAPPAPVDSGPSAPVSAWAYVKEKGSGNGNTGWKPVRPTPVPMILTCPSCGGRHVDVGAFATKPHHTHACQHCGMVWRPALVDTVGVQFLPGYKNEEPTAPPSIVWRREVWNPGTCPGHADPHAASGANVTDDPPLPGDQLRIPGSRASGSPWSRYLLVDHIRDSVWLAQRMTEDGVVESDRPAARIDINFAGRRLPVVPVKT